MGHFTAESEIIWSGTKIIVIITTSSKQNNHFVLAIHALISSSQTMTSVFPTFVFRCLMHRRVCSCQQLHTNTEQSVDNNSNTNLLYYCFCFCRLFQSYKEKLLVLLEQFLQAGCSSCHKSTGQSTDKNSEL